MSKASSDAPPQYSERVPNNCSPMALVPNHTYEENKYGEMDVKLANAPSTRMPTDVVFQENEYGEIYRAEAGSDLSDKAVNSAAAEASDRESDPGHFGEDTAQKAQEYHSDEVYPENKFGELGRADTFVSGEPHLSDRIKGTVEQIAGKATGNKDLYDKGLAHKANGANSDVTGKNKAYY